LAVGVTSAVFDGDTKRAERQRITDNPPDILITNPDMIHWHLRDPRSKVRSLIDNVQFIVFDEIHTYTGAFGSNVHFIILRLRRILGDIQLIGASATIPNAGSFSSKLFNAPVNVVECKQGRRGRIHFVMMYPAIRSDTSMIVDIISDLVMDGYKTLAFANSHKKAEAINILAQESDLYSAIHRGGLPKSYRLLVEKSFKNDELDVVVSTPTLELGIDIGNLDAVVSTLVNFTRLTQRIGRAGRKGQDSIAIVALRSDDPISEYYTKYPDTYFTDFELAYVEPQNEIVAYYQLLSATMDRPVHNSEFPSYATTIAKLRREGLLQLTKKGEFITPVKEATRKLQSYNIRGTGDVVVIKRGKIVLGERGMPLAARELHPGAIYLSAGRKYSSQYFKFKGRTGVAQLDVVPQDLNHRTTAFVNATPQILEIYETRNACSIDVAYCKLRITERTTGYLVRDIFTGELLEEHTLSQPIIYTYDTRGFVFESPRPDKAIEQTIVNEFAHLKEEERTSLANKLLTGAFHALEHVVIESSNMFTGGGSREIGGISLGTSGVVVIHDGTPGGSGLSKLLFNRLEDAISRSHTILKQCKCNTIDGCPKCTFSYQCGNNNRPLFKKGGEYSLAQILEGYKTKIVKRDYDEYESYI
jgi:DEAD/DEAH box helicase domain-containing protein